MATSKFKRDGIDTFTTCFKEDRGEVTVNRDNGYDSQHRDYFWEREIEEKLSHTVIRSLRGLYRSLLETSTLRFHSDKILSDGNSGNKILWYLRNQ